jgi:hypothetical protein
MAQSFPAHITSTNHSVMTTFAAAVFCVLLSGLGVFQLALVAGAPFGHFAWGGRHRVLPKPLRLGSAISVLIYALMAILVLNRADLIAFLPRAVSNAGTWLIVVYALVGVGLNAASRSKPERYAMVPVAFLLFVLSLAVALG